MAEFFDVVEWRRRFPMPQSLDDPTFREWAFSLNPHGNTRLLFELVSWGEPLGVSSEAPQHQRPLIEKLDTFLGELIAANPRHDYRLIGTHPDPQERGAQIRSLIKEQIDVEHLLL